MTKFLNLYFIFAVICLLTITNDLYSQTKINPDLSLSTGFILNLDYEYDNQYAGYISPSIRLNRHELSIGLLVNEKEYNTKFKPSIGGLASYRFYLEKNEKVVNVFVHYSFQLMRYYGTTNLWYMGSNHQSEWRENNINNVIGYGLKIYLNKNKTLSFDNSIGYSIILYSSKNEFYSNNDFSWSGLNLTGGFCYKLCKLYKVN